MFEFKQLRESANKSEIDPGDAQGDQKEQLHRKTTNSLVLPFLYHNNDIFERINVDKHRHLSCGGTVCVA